MQAGSWWRGPAALVLGCALTGGPVAAQELGFVRDGVAVARLSRDRLLAACEPAVVGVDDPYYGRAKRFHALRLDCVMQRGLGGPPEPEDNVFLRARDGYTRQESGARLLEPGDSAVEGSQSPCRGRNSELHARRGRGSSDSPQPAVADAAVRGRRRPVNHAGSGGRSVVRDLHGVRRRPGYL